jgi:hypothetical protein
MTDYVVDWEEDKEIVQTDETPLEDLGTAG